MLAGLAEREQVLHRGIVALLVIFTILLRLPSDPHAATLLDGVSYFNVRSSAKLEAEGFLNLLRWNDQLSWHPSGRDVGQSIHPALSVLSCAVHAVLPPLSLEKVCVFLPPAIGLAAVLATKALAETITGFAPRHAKSFVLFSSSEVLVHLLHSMRT
jgi:hypothetical protein